MWYLSNLMHAWCWNAYPAAFGFYSYCDAAVRIVSSAEM